MPLPDRDFDVTEVAVPWRLLTQAGHDVAFATERGGEAPAADPLLLEGVIFGKLGAEPKAVAAYRLLERAPAFANPIAWRSIEPRDYDALLLAGGHAPGMRQYLGSAELQDKVVAFWRQTRPVAAICHGVLVLARARDPSTGKSPIHASRTTCLPRYMERAAYLLTAWKLGRYYRTYPQFVEDEVRSALDDPAGQFMRGPITLVSRGSAEDDRAAFVVEDGRYVSGRWPGDAYLLSRKLMALLGN
jgi:putative intracellular protease/amidase